MVTLEFLTSGNFTVWGSKHKYKSFVLPFHIILVHDLHQSYLGHNKTFGKNDYHRHLEEWQRKSAQDKELMIKQSQKYIVENFSTPSLITMGIKGNILENWKINYSNINQVIKEKYSSITSFVFWFFLIEQ